MKRYILSCILIMIILTGTGIAAGEAVNESTVVQQEITTDMNSGLIGLVPGWNFVSVPRRLDDSSNTAVIFTPIQAAGHSIWTYNQNEGGWNDLVAEDKILPLEGYWVYSSEPVSIPLKFSNDPLQVPPVKDMIMGWNMFGLTGNTPASARDSLLSIRNSWTEVIGWNPSAQQFETAIVNSGSGEQADTRLLEPEHSYWVYVTEACSLASIGA